MPMLSAVNGPAKECGSIMVVTGTLGTKTFTPDRPSLLHPIRSVASGERISEDLKSLPRRDRWRVPGLRRIGRMFDELHLVNVARAVRKDFRGHDPNYEYRPRKFRAQRVVFADLRNPIYTYSLRALEVEEQQPDVRVDQYISPRSVHAITVVVRNGKGAIVQYLHESG